MNDCMEYKVQAHMKAGRISAWCDVSATVKTLDEARQILEQLRGERLVRLLSSQEPFRIVFRPCSDWMVVTSEVVNNEKD